MDRRIQAMNYQKSGAKKCNLSIAVKSRSRAHPFNSLLGAKKPWARRTSPLILKPPTYQGSVMVLSDFPSSVDLRGKSSNGYLLYITHIEPLNARTCDAVSFTFPSPPKKERKKFIHKYLRAKEEPSEFLLKYSVCGGGLSWHYYFLFSFFFFTSWWVVADQRHSRLAFPANGFGENSIRAA